MSDKKSLIVLVGDPNRKSTELAKEALDKAGIEYRFSRGVDDGLDGPMPQLLSGLISHLGLRSIQLLAYNKIYGTSYIF